MPRAAVLVLLVAATAAADSPVHLGSDRLRHTGRVEAIAYSPDGKLLATADAQAVYLWNAADGSRRDVLPLPGRTVVAASVGNDGAVGAAAHDGTNATRFLRLDPAAGKVVADVPVIPTPGYGAFSPDGRWLALRDRTKFHVLDTATGAVAWGRVIPEDEFQSLAFRPDGRAVAVGRLRGGIAVHEAATGKLIHDFAVGGAVWDLAFSPDGKDLVAEVGVPAPNRVARFEAATGAERWRFVTGRARSLGFSPDGRQVRYWGTGRDRFDPDTWRWLNAETGKLTDRTIDTGPVSESAIRLDGKVLAVAGPHGHVSQWDLATGKRLAASADPPELVVDLRFTPDGKTVRGRAGAWYEWDVMTGKQTRRDLAVPSGGSASADGRWFARIVTDGDDRPRQVEITDLRTGARHGVETGEDRYREVRFLTDGRLMSRTVNELMTFDPETGRRLVRVPIGRDFDGTTSDDGTTAAVVGRPDGDRLRVARWDLRAGRLVNEWTVRPEYEPHPNGFFGHQPELSPDGRVLVYFYSPRDVPPKSLRTTLIDLRTGRVLGRWSDHTRPSGLAFAADGRSVATHFDKSGSIHVREVASGLRRCELRVGPIVTGVAFGPDGRRLAVATAPRPVDLYELADRPAAWDATTAGRAWDALGGGSGEEVLAGIGLLREHAAEAVEFLKTRIKVPTIPTAEWVAARIKALDSPVYRDREKAAAELVEAGELIGPALAAARAKATPANRERLAALIAKAEAPTPDKLRAMRACEVLEGLNTPEARGLLAAWAKGPASATLTREATESLGRLGRR
jgi:WD40 repeat protein